MHVLTVGGPYNPGRRRWPEGPHLRLTPAGCELALFYAQPTRAEVHNVRTGLAQFAWLDAGPVSVLAFRFGTMPWSDVPYEPWKEPDADRGVPAGDAGNSLALQIVLADASTGLVKALRLLAWEPGFAQAVRDTLRRQLASPRDDTAAARKLDELYQHDSAALADQAAARHTGGGPARPASPAPKAALGRYVAAIIPGKSYPEPLPPDLAPWYVYTQDGGHQIAIALASFYRPGASPADFVVPAPVRAVLRQGWTVRDGWVVCDLPYDTDMGLITDPGGNEY